jgi:hypothetical protein
MTSIFALPELAETPASGDLVPLTDVSDTTQSANGSTKKIQISNLIASAVNQKTTLLPQQSIPPMSSINAAALTLTESTSAGTYKPVFYRVAFDDTTDEGRMWLFRPPQTFTTATLKILYYMSGANTSKNVGWVAYLSAISDTDTSFTANAFDSANTGTTVCPDAAGTVDEASITLTNGDSIAAGDWVCLLLRRNAAVASDATGDAIVIMCEVQYA